MQNLSKQPRLMPWYVHIVGSWSFGALFSWYLTSAQFFSRGRKKSAAAMMGAVACLFCLVWAGGYYARVPYHVLTISLLSLSMLLSLAAWLVQRNVFGAAPKRYYFAQWRSWIVPVLTAVLMGFAFSVVICFIPIIGDRIKMYQAEDILTKKVVLWEFFRYIPHSLIFSLPVGVWWAGEQKRFSSATVISYFFGLVFSSLILSIISGLFYFLMSKGQVGADFNPGSLIPNQAGWRKWMEFINDHDYSAYFFMPLLLGTLSGIGEFFKRSLAIYPILTTSFLAYCFYSTGHWNYYQTLIIYEMSSADAATRERAFDEAEVLLARYPEHENWPKIAAMTADYRYRQGDSGKALELYGKILERSRDGRQWHNLTEIATAALAGEGALPWRDAFKLAMPPLGYESYMTCNWMVLLRNLRYYEAEKFSEADTLIRLKNISKDDDEIDLPVMPTLAELYDNASNLGYDVLLLPSDAGLLRRMIQAGFPVIQPIKQTFNLLTGIDEGRAAFIGSSYRNLLAHLKKDDMTPVAAGTLFGDGKAPDSDQDSRMELLAETTIPFSFWQSSRHQDQARHMGVVFPQAMRDKVLAALGGDRKHLETASKAILTAHIADGALNCSDIIQAITWAKESYSLSEDVLPLHISHLAYLVWQSRDKIIGSKLHLERQLPALGEVDRFLADPENHAFLDMARRRFAADLEQKRLSWQVRQQYRSLLDISDAAERKILIAMALTETRHDPDNRTGWIHLAGLYEWDKDTAGMIIAYSGALAAEGWDDNLALKLARLQIDSGDYKKAGELLGRVDPSSVKYDPTYYYCLASIADSRDQFGKAARYYEKAIEMRRYDRTYHLSYADLLERYEVHPDRAAKLRDWASRLAGDTRQEDILTSKIDN